MAWNTIKTCGTLLGMLLLGPSTATAAVIVSDTTWSEEVAVTGDVLIPEGVTLTVAPGTRVLMTPAESTKTDPEFLSALTEITVRGTLIVKGKEGAPVTFSVSGEQKALWAGIIIDGGKAVLRSARISDADTGVFVIRGSLVMGDSRLTGNRYGLTVQGQEAAVRVTATRVTENDYGVTLFNGAKLDRRDLVVQGNRKKDSYAASARDCRPQMRDYAASDGEVSRVFGDEVILGTVVWQKRVVVQGIVRVPEHSRLIVLPGTVVEFRRKDTNRDGIGENGILVQGVIIAKGTRENPIVFRSAEKQRRMGDWDSINIMNSDAAQNLIEYCQIQDAYRGLHFHFSNVAVADSVLKNNYRGIQFQESVVSVRGTHFYANKSALQARDSEISFTGNVVYRNYAGLNVLRNSLTISGNSIINNYLEGLRVREGLPVVERNQIDGNRHGVMVTDAFYGTYASNVISHNLESGVSLKGAESIGISGNIIQGNGINGISVQDSGGIIEGNLISDNAERGVGVVSFQGAVTGNVITANGMYNLGIDGPGDVSATGNWWGGGDVRAAIYDKTNDPSRGTAHYQPVSSDPPVIKWPLAEMRSDASWRGTVSVSGAVAVVPGVTLRIVPDTRVLFAKGAGLSIMGKILARGEKETPVIFSGMQGTGAGEWDEIILDHASGSVFSNCLLRDATWALHSHFTDLTVEGCVFRNNEGGLRFTSGPLTVKHSLFEGNGIGIRAFRGTALIRENSFTGNKIGIFVREKGGGLTITKNNFSENADYGIRLGDFNTEDVNAPDNWWGAARPADAIFDARQEPGIGTVRFEPAADRPFQIPPPFEGAGRPTPEPLPGGDL